MSAIAPRRGDVPLEPLDSEELRFLRKTVRRQLGYRRSPVPHAGLSKERREYLERLAETFSVRAY